MEAYVSSELMRGLRSGMGRLVKKAPFVPLAWISCLMVVECTA